MKALNKERVSAVLDRLAAEAEVRVPLSQGGTSAYGVWGPSVKGNLALDLLNTILSPKEALLPQTERIYSFVTEGQQAGVQEVYTDPQKRVLFGVRACDRKALADLDLVFLTRGYEDASYKARRDNLTVIGLACRQPGPNCFCQSMGVDPMGGEGCDILLYDLGELYGWEAVTGRGQELTAALGDLLEERELARPDGRECPLKVDLTGLPEKLAGLFEHPVWEELAAPCMNCGICTYHCPSCYCFDIQVKSRGAEGYRFRCWDSCMYPEYTLMAGGHNPRGTKKERFRNRFLHKLEFFQERYGTSLCTGCGRCLVLCPNGISITRIIKVLQEVDAGVR